MKTRKNNHLFSKISEILLYGFIFLLPTQLGKHFFLPWSYIGGVRIDYLAPTLFVTDILAFFIFIFFFRSIFTKIKTKLFFSVFLFALLNILVAHTPLIALYQWLKFLEVWILYIAYKEQKTSVKNIILIFLASTILQTVLSVLQIIEKQTLQGFWYFLGERSLSLSSPDVAKITIQGIELLRPYGTFSHPNSLAGYFLLIFVFFTFQPIFDRYGVWRQILTTLCFFLIVLSSSQTTIIVFGVIQVIYALYWARKTKCTVCLLPKLILVIPIIFLLILGGHDPQSFSKRWYLIQSSFQIIYQYAITGVGLGNYLYFQAKFPSLFYPPFLQPVHNIALLFISEVGIVGIAVFMQILSYWITTVRTYEIILLLALTVFLTGMADHYWLTLQQNLLLLGVVFGLAANQFLQMRKKNRVK